MTAAVVNAVARWGSTRRRGQVATWLAGLVIFFDDYANAMILGPSMRPVCDRLGISRAKLAYIVDSTAAPVASIALIGTWIAYEIGCIQAGLAGRPSQGFVLNRAEGRSTLVAMPKRESTERGVPAPGPAGRPSALVDTRVIYCGDCLDQLRKLPDGCVDGVYLWHRFPTGESNSNRNYEVFWGGQSEPRAQASGFSAQTENRHASTAPYIDYMRPRCVELARGALDVRRRI